MEINWEHCKEVILHNSGPIRKTFLPSKSPNGIKPLPLSLNDKKNVEQTKKETTKEGGLSTMRVEREHSPRIHSYQQMSCLIQET